MLLEARSVLSLGHLSAAVLILLLPMFHSIPYLPCLLVSFLCFVLGIAVVPWAVPANKQLTSFSKGRASKPYTSGVGGEAGGGMEATQLLEDLISRSHGQPSAASLGPHLRSIYKGCCPVLGHGPWHLIASRGKPRDLSSSSPQYRQLAEQPCSCLLLSDLRLLVLPELAL